MLTKTGQHRSLAKELGPVLSGACGENKTPDEWPPEVKGNKRVSVTWCLIVCYESHMKLTQQVTSKYMPSQTNDSKQGESVPTLYSIPSYISYISYCCEKTPKEKKQAGGRAYVYSRSEEVKAVTVGEGVAEFLVLRTHCWDSSHHSSPGIEERGMPALTLSWLPPFISSVWDLSHGMLTAIVKVSLLSSVKSVWKHTQGEPHECQLS